MGISRYAHRTDIQITLKDFNLYLYKHVHIINFRHLMNVVPESLHAFSAFLFFHIFSDCDKDHTVGVLAQC